MLCAHMAPSVPERHQSPCAFSHISPSVIICLQSYWAFSHKWWNCVYRKVFGYNKWVSVRCLICMCNRLDIIHLANLRDMVFLKRQSTSENTNNVINRVFYYCMQSGEFAAV